MPTMALARAAELHACRVRLTTGPAAAAEARGQGRTAICAWDAHVAGDVAVLLIRELEANAIRHTAGEAVTPGIQCARIQLRVDGHDTSSSLPVLADAPSRHGGWAAGRVLVTNLPAEWGFHRTPAGKAVSFTLAFQPDLVAGLALGRTPARTPPVARVRLPGSQRRSMAEPSGELGEATGKPLKPGSAGEPE